MHIHYDIPLSAVPLLIPEPRTQNYMLLSEGNSAPHVDDLMYRSDTGQVNYLFGGVASGPRAKDTPRPRAGASDSDSASARLRASASLGPGVCSGSLSKILERLSS